MKKISLLLSLVALSIQFVCAQEIPTPAAGKALVIFTRPKLEAPIIKFSYFDNDQFLGKMGIKDFVAYECEPGKHLLWAKSENRFFIEAELEADNIYLIETKITTGMLKARIGLVPYDPEAKNADKVKQRVLAHIAKRNEIRADANTTQTTTDDHKKTIEKGLADYQKRKEKKKKIDVLTPAMHI